MTQQQSLHDSSLDLQYHQQYQYNQMLKESGLPFDEHFPQTQLQKLELATTVSGKHPFNDHQISYIIK